MDKKVKKPEDMTWADIRATLAEAAALSKENEIGLKELRETVAATSAAVADLIKSTKNVDDEVKNVKDDAEEKKKEWEETKKAIADLTKSTKNVDDEVKNVKDDAEGKKKEWEETKKAIADLTKSTKDLRGEVKGIGKSNGMMSEEYFFNTLNESMAFGGYHFDSVERNRGRKCIGKDGKPVETEYDVLMINDIAACIVEVKYRARKYHIDKLLEKVGKFKIQFPHCANHKVFLGIGALAFDEGVEEEAQNYGMGILKQNGDAVEIYDKDLKVY